MSLRLYEGTEAIAMLGGPWRDLERRCSAHPFQSWAFASAWSHTVCPDERSRALIVALEESDGISALFPASLSRIGPASLLTWLAGPLLADYGDVLYDPATASLSLVDFVEGALSLLGRRAPRSALFLPNVRSDASVAPIFAERLAVFKVTEAPYVPIPGDFETCLREVRRHHTHDYERRERKLAAAGDVRFEVLSAHDAEFAPTLTTLIELQARRFDTGRGSGHRLFAPGCRSFYPTWAALEPGVICARMTLDGHIISAALRCIYRGRMLGMLTAFDEQYRQFSPGVQIAGHLLEEACRLGLDVVDLGPGTGSHKSFWTKQSEPLTTFVSRGFSGGMLLTAARIRRRLRRESVSSLA